MTNKTITPQETEVPQVQYKFGDMFLIRNSLHVLAHVDTNTVALISFENGKPWTVPVRMDVNTDSTFTVDQINYIANDKMWKAASDVWISYKTS